MEIVEHFPHKIVEHELVWVPLSDGTRLAARILLPEDAEQHPVPAILEYIPYRRRDRTRTLDDLTHPYFAGHGFASIRIDIRGTGDSEGVLLDEYLVQEQDDALEAIAWIASRPWCSGQVGMIGLSWGGFSALQVAARRPPALKAIITVASTDDRYADDAHHRGGCLLTEAVMWGGLFFTIMRLPPDPRMVGEARWRPMWRERLEAASPEYAGWMEHARRDAFWKHGSVCEDYAEIEAAVLTVGGWADAYSNAVFRLLEHLPGPKRGVIGPWGHMYPHIARPGPAIGFLQEALRWWNQWLRGQDTGVLHEPLLRAYLEDGGPVAGRPATRPGRWVAETSWPSPNVVEESLHLGPRVLSRSPQPDGALSISSPESTGSTAGERCPGRARDLPRDQREDDGRSLIFDSEPLREPLEILGAPIATLELVSDQAQAMLAVRLCDVAPDGASSRVSYALLNLSHRDGHERPEALEPGKRTRVVIRLNEAGHAFAAGNRIRLGISTCYWPLAFPAPRPVVLTVHLGASQVSLPVRSAHPRDAEVQFGAPQASAAGGTTSLEPPRGERRLERNLESGEIVLTVESDSGRSVIDAIGVETRYASTRRVSIRDGEPTSARAEHDMDVTHAHEGWRARVRTSASIACTEDDFLIEARLEAFDDGEPFFARSWSRRIPRDLV